MRDEKVMRGNVRIYSCEVRVHASMATVGGVT